MEKRVGCLHNGEHRLADEHPQLSNLGDTYVTSTKRKTVMDAKRWILVHCSFWCLSLIEMEFSGRQ